MVSKSYQADDYLSQQERLVQLDDAIHVLRNHAEAGQFASSALPMGGAGGMIGSGGLMSDHSSEMSAVPGSIFESRYTPSMAIPASIDGHTVS